MCNARFLPVRSKPCCTAASSGAAVFCAQYHKEVNSMETRVATVGIIVEDLESVEPLNALLHDYGQFIIGRMGIPYRDKKLNVIMVAVDAPQDEISAMSGKIGRLHGVTAKTAYSNVVFKSDAE